MTRMIMMTKKKKKKKKDMKECSMTLMTLRLF